MSNDFFDDADWTEIQRLSLARSALINAIVSAIVAGFDLFPSLARMLEGRIGYGTDAGTANAHVVTLPYTFTLTDGARFTYKPLNTNTGPLTCNPNALGALPVRDFGGNALVGGESVAGAPLELIMVGTTELRIMQPRIAVASVTTFDIDGLTSTSTVNPAADWVPIHSAAAGAKRKVLAGSIADEGQIILANSIFGI